MECDRQAANCAGSISSAFKRSITLRRTYSEKVMRCLAAARSIAGGSEAGQRTSTRLVISLASSVADFFRAQPMAVSRLLVKPCGPGTDGVRNILGPVGIDVEHHHAQRITVLVVS